MLRRTGGFFGEIRPAVGRPLNIAFPRDNTDPGRTVGLRAILIVTARSASGIGLSNKPAGSGRFIGARLPRRTGPAGRPGYSASKASS